MSYLYLRQEPRLGFYGDDASGQQVNGIGAPVVTPGRNPDEIIVTRDNGTRYHVRRKVRAQVLTRPGRPRAGFCGDDERLFFRVSWCEGTQGTIDVGANVPRALKELLNTVVRPDQPAREPATRSSRRSKTPPSSHSSSPTLRRSAIGRSQGTSSSTSNAPASSLRPRRCPPTGAGSSSASNTSTTVPASSFS